jgi:hypothetical protein
VNASGMFHTRDLGVSRRTSAGVPSTSGGTPPLGRKRSGASRPTTSWVARAPTVDTTTVSQGRFRLPRIAAGRVEFDATTLAMLLDGIDVKCVARPARWSPPSTRQGPKETDGVKLFGARLGAVVRRARLVAGRAAAGLLALAARAREVARGARGARLRATSARAGRVAIAPGWAGLRASALRAREVDRGSQRRRREPGDGGEAGYGSNPRSHGHHGHHTTGARLGADGRDDARRRDRRCARVGRGGRAGWRRRARGARCGRAVGLGAVAADDEERQEQCGGGLHAPGVSGSAGADQLLSALAVAGGLQPRVLVRERHERLPAGVAAPAWSSKF